MIAVDETALDCDLAEVYHIYDKRSLPADKVAAFSVGLRNNSRIKLKLSGTTVPFETILLASAVDNLALLVWRQTKDGANNRNKPKSVAALLLGKEVETQKDFEVFETPEEFEQAMAKIERREG